MLATTPNPSTRPRPPAKARRAPSKFNVDDQLDSLLGPPPPPPYNEPALVSPMGTRRIVETVTTTTTTTTIMEKDEQDAQEMKPLNEWFEERSRDELSHMLLQAERIIRAREAELGHAAETGRALRDLNEALRDKHNALLARLPGSPSSLHSRSSSTWSLRDDANADKLSRPPSPRQFQTPVRAHGRRPSVVSPANLALLSEQNEELRSRIAELENETAEADHSGKKKLRRLEKDIEALRLELELLEQRNGELERQVHTTQPLEEDADLLERKKLEREEKARAIREQSMHPSDSTSHFQDFAPSSSISSLASYQPRYTRQPHSEECEYPDEDPSHLSVILSATEPSTTPGASRPSTIGPGAGETAIVVQLLAKIEELERANREITEQQAKTSHKLEQAGQDVNEIRMAFEGFEDEFTQGEQFAGAPGDLDGWSDLPPSPTRPLNQISTPEEFGRSPSPSNFGSFGPRQRKLSTPMRAVTSIGSTTPRSQRTHSVRASMNKGSLSKRARKALTHSLFVSPSTSRPISQSPASSRPGAGYPARAIHRNSSHLRASSGRSRASSLSESTSPRSSFLAALNATFGTGSPQRPLSMGPIGHAGSRGLGHAPHRSLGSELGLDNEFGANWGNQSLADEQDDIQRRDQEPLGSLTTTSANGEGSRNSRPLPPLNLALAAIKAALEKRGQPLEQDEHILPVGSLRASPAETFYGLNCAVAARPSRWASIDSGRLILPQIDITSASVPNPFMDGEQTDKPDPWEATRYPSEAEGQNCSLEDDDTQGRNGQDTLSSRRDVALLRLTKAFNSRRLSSSSARSSESNESFKDFDVVTEAEQPKVAKYQPEERNRYDPVALAERLQKTSLKTFLEVWLLLQFVLVIGVFVYTSMKQGPRAVLGTSVGKRKTT